MSGMWDRCKCWSYSIDPLRDILLPLRQIARSAVEQQQRLSGWQKSSFAQGHLSSVETGLTRTWRPSAEILSASSLVNFTRKSHGSDWSSLTFCCFGRLHHFLTDVLWFVLLADFKVQQFWLGVRFPWSLNKNVSLVSQSFKGFLFLIRFIVVCLRRRVLNSSIKLSTDYGPSMIHHPDNCWLWICCLFMSAVYHWIYRFTCFGRVFGTVPSEPFLTCWSWYKFTCFDRD